MKSTQSYLNSTFDEPTDQAGRRDSCWTSGAPETAFAALGKSGRADVAIVGGGIVGLTTAYLLARAGVSVALLEARRIGRQVTGRSTAKVTSQHALIYKYLTRNQGLETARLYADANQSAVLEISRWVASESIACDLEPKDAYVYALHAQRRAAIDAEAETARRLGLDAEVLGAAPLPFATAGALRFRGQAQFNPIRYSVGLANAAIAHGAAIFEETRVTSVKKGKRWRIIAGRHHLDAASVVLATNLPIAGPVSFDKLTQPRCHIAMAFRVRPEASIDGMFIGIDQPAHSLRMGSDRDGVRKGFNQGGDTRSLVRGIEQIRPGHGGVVKRGREKIAVWKSLDGKPHALSAACTHKGCTVTWNNASLTWDCPCHGSIYSHDGQVIHGPATEALATKPIPSATGRRRTARRET